MPDVYQCRIAEKEKLSESLFEFAFVNESLARESKPGQFLHIRCGEERLLRRPISISDVRGSELTFVVEARGEGTGWLCGRTAGDALDIIGPLGRGFSIPERDAIVVGGGVGVPPLLFAAKSVRGSVTAILGFRDSHAMMLLDEFEDVCDKVYVTTEDGGYGIQGLATGPLEMLLKEGGYSAVLTCGPHPMMSAVAMLCKKHAVPCQASMEERMACGVGACLVCACATKTAVKEQMSRVCADGPVFDAEEIVW